MYSLTPGTILHGKNSNYVILKALGQGSYGITYLARIQMQGMLGSIDNNSYVAVKEFFMRDINGRENTSVTSGNKGGIFSEYKRRFAREAQNLSKLKHSHIIKVMESFEENNTIYYSMEYLGGGSLDDYITKKGCINEFETLNITKQICSALSFMHNNNMLHLDLKPANIMRREDGSIVLIDFGLSKQYDVNGEPESSTTVGKGTPGYAPLEQANYQDGHGFPVTMDVYALGATMFKMLTGKRAPEASVILNDGFPKDSLHEMKSSEEVLSIIEMAMAPMKKNRLQTVEEFLIALNLIDNNEPEDSKEYIVEPEFEDTVVEELSNNISCEQIQCVFFSKKTMKDGLLEESISYTVNQKSLTIVYLYSKGKSYKRTTKISKAKWDRMLSIIKTLKLMSNKITNKWDRNNMVSMEFCLYSSEHNQKSNILSRHVAEKTKYARIEYEWNRIGSIIGTVDNGILQWIESCKRSTLSELNNGPFFTQKNENFLINAGVKELVVIVKDGNIEYTYKITKKLCEMSYRHKDFICSYHITSFYSWYFERALKEMVAKNYYRNPFKRPQSYPPKFLEIKFITNTYSSVPYEYMYIGVRNAVIEEGNIKSTYNAVLSDVKELPCYIDLLDACKKAEAKNLDESKEKKTVSSKTKTVEHDHKKETEENPSNIVSSIYNFFKSLK